MGDEQLWFFFIRDQIPIPTALCCGGFSRSLFLAVDLAKETVHFKHQAWKNQNKFRVPSTMIITSEKLSVPYHFMVSSPKKIMQIMPRQMKFKWSKSNLRTKSLCFVNKSFRLVLWTRCYKLWKIQLRRNNYAHSTSTLMNMPREVIKSQFNLYFGLFLFTNLSH